MANYSLVVDSTFQPFSFERYIQPYQIYGQEYKAQEDLLSDLAVKSSIWEEMANEQTDPNAYRMYKRYYDDLKAQADILATKGLTPSNRKDILKMKERYSREITPIENAYNRRQELINQQREALLKDNTLMFDTDYSVASLDYMINNPNATFKSLSGESIAKRTAAMAEEVANSIISNPEYESIYNSQYVQQMLKQGFDMEQIIAAAQRDSNAPKELLNIVDTIKREVGYDTWSGSKDMIDNYINEGLNAAASTTKIDVMNNRAYMNPLELERAQLQNEYLKAQIEESKGIVLPDGSRVVKLGSGNYAHFDKDGNLLEDSILPQTREQKTQDKESAELEKKLQKVSTVADMKDTGFTPVGVVIKHSGSWQRGIEGQDIQDTWRGATNSNLKSKGNIWPATWGWGSGDYSYTPKDIHAEASIVNNPETIPGYTEWLEGDGYLDINSAFGQILQQAYEAGITDEEFFTDNVRILKVKSKRKGSDNYDYIIYRKS